MKKRALNIIAFLIIVFLIVIVIGDRKAETPWHLTNVTEHLPDLNFELTDDKGQTVNQQTYQGKITLLYFGFTQCPDECPVTMARITSMLQKMGKDADPIQVLFVSVDPHHDTPQILHDYLQSFDPKHMIGLTGPEAEIEKLTKRYRAAYQKNDDGEIVHGNALYIFDGDGHARLIASDQDPDQDIIDDLERLIHALH